jgi:hypothetical protein
MKFLLLRKVRECVRGVLKEDASSYWAKPYQGIYYLASGTQFAGAPLLGVKFKYMNINA